MTLDASEDGDILVSGSHDRSIKIWDLANRACLHVFKKAHEGKGFSIEINLIDKITSVALTHDNKKILSASWDCAIKVWDIPTKSLIHSIPNAHLGM
jgi:FOG: WD40 repeat